LNKICINNPTYEAAIQRELHILSTYVLVSFDTHHLGKRKVNFDVLLTGHFSMFISVFNLLAPDLFF